MDSNWWRQRGGLLLEWLRSVAMRNRSTDPVADLKVFVLGILYFKLLIQYNEIGDHPQPCIASYLERSGHNEATPFNGSSIICNFYNTILHFKIENEFERVMSEKKFHEHLKTCIKTKADGSSFVENLARKILRDENLKLQENRIVKIEESLDDYFYQCMDLTNVYRYFQHIFNVFKESSLLDEWRIVKDYCFKTYFLDNQLIRSDFDLKPITDLVLDKKFCYHNAIEPIKKYVIEPNFLTWIGIEKLLPLAYKVCVIEELENSIIFGKFSAVAIASSMGMTKDEKEIELKDFDRIYRQFAIKVHKNCDVHA